MNYQRYLHYLLKTALDKQASDLHIVPFHKPVLRITRQLAIMEKERVISPSDAQGLAFTLMGSFEKERFSKERSVDLAYDFEGRARFRINVFHQKGAAAIALRLIPAKIRSIEELNLPPILHKFPSAGQGLVLITGAASQGKSTTLASFVEEINQTRKAHIITIEQPIEYSFKSQKSLISQKEVGNDALNFASALRATLREDPDVIMVGEMRDLETVGAAITAAETGHLVFATLHTNSASQTVHRIIDVFPPHQQNQIRVQLASSLLGVVTQRLLPGKNNNFVPVCEIMFCNYAVQNLIRENKIHEILAVIETSAKDGMMSFDQHLLKLFRAKKISKEQAVQYSLRPEHIASRLS